jgi:flagellar assembly protein FliH
MLDETRRANEAPVKFLFDMEFTGTGAHLGADARAAVAAADAEGYRRGFAAGEAEAGARIERRLGAALECVGTRAEEIARRLADVESRLEHEAVEVAVAAARKLSAALIAREPLGEVEALVREVLAQVRNAPHLVVRVAESLVEPAGERLRALAEERGFAGRLVLVPAPELAPDEARIEWADGGVERDREAIERRIDEAVARYLARGQANGTRESDR